MLEGRINQNLDNYITEIHQHPEQDIAHRCPNCDKTWRVPMVFDTGSWIYRNDDDAYCPKCGTVGQIIYGPVQGRPSKDME